MSALSWTLPYPPCTTNSMYVATGRGSQRVLGKVAVKWRDEIIARIRDGGQPRPPPGLLSIRLDLWPGDERRRDVDGPSKLAIDAVAAALSFDDYRISHVEMRRHAPSRGNPRLEVVLATDTEATGVG